MNCPVCLHPVTRPALTGADIFFETSTDAFNLSGCAACHSLFLDPLPTEEQVARFYPAQYWWKSSAGLLRRLERIYRRAALRDHVAFIARAATQARSDAEPIRILDVGCGSGTLLGRLKESGFDVLGVDFSAEASAIARTENNVEVIVGSLRDARFAAQSFDVVTLFHVMEHVLNPREVLAEVRRILRANGRLVVQVPNIESWQFRLFGAQWYGLDIPRHVIDYSADSLQKLLRESGFRVDRVRHFNLRDNAPAFASSVFRSLDPVSRSVRQRQRGMREPSMLAWSRHMLYLAAVGVAYPFAVAEALAGCGATVMVQAAKER